MKKFIVSKVFLLLLILTLSFTFVGCDLSNFGFSFGLDDNGEPVIEDDEGNKANIDVDNEQVEKLFYRFSNGKYSYEEWKNALLTDDVEIYFDGKTLSYSYKDEGAKIDLVNYDLLVQELAALSCNLFDSGSALYYQLNNGSWIFLCNYTVEEGRKDDTEYTVYFIVEGERETVKVKGSNKLTHTDPYKEGYRFVGWELNGEIVTLSNVHLSNELVFIAVFEEINDDEVVLTKQQCSKTTHSLGSTDTLFASFKGYYNGYFSLYFSGVYGVSYSDFKLTWEGGEIGLGEYLKSMGDMDGFTIDDEGSLIKSGYINIDYRQLAGEHPKYSFLQLRYIGGDTNVRFTVTSYYLIDENHQNYLEIYRDGALCDTIAITVNTIYSLESYALPGYEITGWHTNNGLSGDNFSPTFWDIYDLPTKLFIESKKVEDYPSPSILNEVFFKEYLVVDDLSKYSWICEINPEGAQYIKLSFTCNDNSTLKTFRFSGMNGTKWVKDYQIIDINGNLVSPNTKLNGLDLYIDVERSGFDKYEWIQIETGDFDGTVKGGSCIFDLYQVFTEVEEELYTVFICNYDGTYNSELYVKPGYPVDMSLIEIPERDGYVCDGFLLEYETPFAADEPINNDGMKLVIHYKYVGTGIDIDSYQQEYLLCNYFAKLSGETTIADFDYTKFKFVSLNFGQSNIRASAIMLNSDGYRITLRDFLSSYGDIYGENYLNTNYLNGTYYLDLSNILPSENKYIAISYISATIIKDFTIEVFGYYDINDLCNIKLYGNPYNKNSYDSITLTYSDSIDLTAYAPEGYFFMYWYDENGTNYDSRFLSLKYLEYVPQEVHIQYGKAEISTEYDIIYYGLDEDGKYKRHTEPGNYNSQLTTVGFGDVSIFVDDKLFPLPEYALIDLGKDIKNDVTLSTKEKLQVYGTDGTTLLSTGLIIKDGVITPINSYGHGALYYNSSNYNITISDVTMTYGRNLPGNAYGYNRYIFRYNEEKNIYICEYVGNPTGNEIKLYPNDYLWCPMTAERYCTGLTDCDGTSGVLGSLANGKYIFIVNTWDYIEKKDQQELISDDEMYDITYVSDNYEYGTEATYDSFEEALAHTKDYGTIKISSGEYYEALIINKQVTIIGPNSEVSGRDHDIEEAVIYSGISIKVSNVSISGLTIYNNIYFDVTDISDIIISNNIFKHDSDPSSFSFIGIREVNQVYNCTNLTINGNYSEAITNSRFICLSNVNNLSVFDNYFVAYNNTYDLIRVYNCASGDCKIADNYIDNFSQSAVFFSGVGNLCLDVSNNTFNNMGSTVIDTRNYVGETQENVDIIITHNIFNNSGAGWSPIRVRDNDFLPGYLDVTVQFNIFNNCWYEGNGYRQLFENANNSSEKYLTWDCNYIYGETNDTLSEEMFGYTAYYYSGVNSIEELEEAYVIANGIPYNNENYANLKIDFMDGTVGSSYINSNWKQEKYLTQWIEVKNQMNCREKDGERVVNFANGYSKPIRFTYSEENIGVANSLTLRIGNYFNQADDLFIKIIIEDTEGNEHYLWGGPDSFETIPVTEGLLNYGFVFEKIDVKSLIFITRSDMQNNAYLYMGDINLVYN